jgi:putative transposase
VWADGIYSTLRGEDDHLCRLILIGVNEQGEKRLLALSDGYRESQASWLSVLQDLQARGLKTPPILAIGDGALGFWAALDEAWPETRRQRCWIHKTGQCPPCVAEIDQGKSRPKKRSTASFATSAPSIPRRWKSWSGIGWPC